MANLVYKRVSTDQQSTARQNLVLHEAGIEGRSIAALARDHDVSRGAIRTAIADLLPEYTAAVPDTSTPELPVVLDMPRGVRVSR